LPAVTRALSKWTSLASRGAAVGITHAAGCLGAGASAPIVALLITWFSWRFSFVALGVVSAVWAAAWWWSFYEDPRQHPRITRAELAALPETDPQGQIGSGPVPWRRLVPRVAPLMIVYFCQGWTGWLFVTWMPSLLQKNYGLDLKKSSLLYAAMLFCAMIAEFLGGVVTDYLLGRTRNLQIARSRMIAASWVLVVAGLVPATLLPAARRYWRSACMPIAGELLAQCVFQCIVTTPRNSSAPSTSTVSRSNKCLAILVHDVVVGLTGFTVALFFLGFAIAPLWTATMDIAPNYAGSSSALMNASGAVAGILSPVAFGWLLDRTGSWTTPFSFSVGLLLFAIVVTWWIRPDRPIDVAPSLGRLAVAGE
jgi:nitrate/nitrite transporter NarK